MARPPKFQDHFVHRIAELIQLADGVHKNEQLRKAFARGGITFVMGDGTRTVIDRPEDIAVEVGRVICGDVGGVHLKCPHLKMRTHLGIAPHRFHKIDKRERR